MSNINFFSMKNLTLTFLFGLIFSAVFAQNSKIVIFTNVEDAKFQAKLNGVVQNNTFSTTTNIDNLDTKTYKLRIEFLNQDVKPIDKSVEINPNMEYTFEIIEKSDAKQKFSKFGNRMARDVTLRDRDTSSLQDLYQLKAISLNPIRNANVNNFSTSDNTNNTQTEVKSTNANNNVSTNATTNVSTNVSYTTTSTTNVNPTNSSASMNVNAPGINMNVNISDNTSGTYQETYTTTTTTQNTADHYVMQGYSGPIGCPWPMNDNDFYNAKNSILSKSFDDSKLVIAKQIAGSNCLTSSQVRDIAKLFSFEDSKLDFAKYCYGYTFDLGNYYMVNDAFDFESTIDELNNYINSR